MEFFYPEETLAGFHLDELANDHPALRHAGEQWARVDWQIDWHEHGVWEFYLQCEGATKWETAQQHYTIEKFDFLAVAPGIKHRMLKGLKNDHHFLYLALNPGYFETDEARGWVEMEEEQVVVIRQADSLLEPFRLVIRELSLEGRCRTEGLELASRLLMLESFRLLQGKSRMNPMLRQHPAIAHCKDLLEKHPGQDWSIGALGKMVGLSPNYMLELFRKEVGKTPHAYLMDMRMKRAKERLANTSLQLTEIAHSLGFSSSQHFSNSFKKVVGITPSGYRKQRQSGSNA